MSSKQNNKQNETVQTSLFGGLVSQNEDRPLKWLRVYDEVANEGDTMTMRLTAAAFNDEKGCLTVIDGDNDTALTVWFENHPDAKFTSTPDGVRLGRAVERALKQPIASHDGLVDAIKGHDLTLTVTHTGVKGRLWTID